MFQRAQHKIDAVVGRWPGVTSGAHRFGGMQWRLGTCEIGRIHDDGLVDIPLPRRLRDELEAAHRVEMRGAGTNVGRVTLRLETDDDLKWAVVLLRHAYELARQSVARRTGRPVPYPKTASTAAGTLAEVA